MGSLRTSTFVLISLCMLTLGDGARRHRAQRRQDTDMPSLLASPSVETIKKLAVAMGAAEFESYTEGSKPIVKRLIPDNSEPDLVDVSYQGVIGKAGVDFPAFPKIPDTGFDCKHVATGYYADLETDCQVFHICDSHRKISFLCPNGTIFSQTHLICDWWFKVDCASSPALYEASAELYSQEQSKRQRNSRPSKACDSCEENYSSDQHMAASTERQYKVVAPETKSYSSQVKATAKQLKTIVDNKQQQRDAFGFEKRRKNLVQLISNSFGPVSQIQYKEANTYRTPTTVAKEKESQEVAETAGIANERNRQMLQGITNAYKPYPVYSPVPTTRYNAPVRTTAPTYQTDFRTSVRSDHGRNLIAAPHVNNDYFTTKRPTLIPYTKFTTNQEPYTRPGVNSLRDFLQKEKNKNKTSANAALLLNNQNTETHFPISRSENSAYTADASSPNVYYSTNEIYGPTKPTYTEQVKSEKNSEGNYGDRTFGSRPGLIVPPSLTPKTLHSLAIYYATAVDNISTSPKNESSTEPPTTATPEELPSVLSQQTISRYSSLFSMMANSEELLEELRADNNVTDNELEDLSMAMSQGPLSSSPQIRELAQVFTHALSAYLQDPVQFRKVLSDIRPTQPAFTETVTTQVNEELKNDEEFRPNEEDEEILGFSDDNKPENRFSKVRESSLVSPCCSLNPDAEKIQLAPTTTEGDPENTFTDDDIEVTTTYPPFTIRVEDTTTTDEPTTTTTKLPFKCCGSISAAYTSASTEKQPSTTPLATTTYSSVTTTYRNKADLKDSSYNLPKYGGFQNNTSQNYSPYGREIFNRFNDARPLSENDIQSSTNIPAAWGEVTTNGYTSTATNLASAVNSIKDIKLKDETNTRSPASADKYYAYHTTPVDLLDEEELQRAHSQSFLSPKDNSHLRDGKNLKIDEKNIVKRPSQDLEVPASKDGIESKTTITYSASTKYLSDETTGSTPPTTAEIGTTYSGSEKLIKDAGNPYIWSTNFDNWHSTVVLDPITLNDGLNAMREEFTAPSAAEETVSNPTISWDSNIAYQSTTPTPKNDRFSFVTRNFDYNGHQPSTQIYYPTTYFPSTGTSYTQENIPINPANRGGRVFPLNPSDTSTEFSSTPLDEKVIEKAKDIMGEMNVTNGDTIMDAMKKTKSKTVKRLILLLVQTCDDDHNKTAEASKKALLEALMTLSQRELENYSRTEELTSTTPVNFDLDRQSNTHRRMDKMMIAPYIEEPSSKQSVRSGKSLRNGANINYVTAPITSSTHRPIASTTTTTTTTTIKPTYKRGLRKFLVRTSQVDNKVKSRETSSELKDLKAEQSKQSSDTRALELLRSLYSIAAKWG